MQSMKPYVFLLALAVCAGTYGQSFECYPVGALPTALPSCEGVTSNNLDINTGVSATPACGFPTDGAQYVQVLANGPIDLPFGGPLPRPVSPVASEVRIPIPAGATTVSFDWEFFNNEGPSSGAFNDGMSIDIVDASGVLVQPLVYSDTSNPSSACANGGTEIAPPGPQRLVTSLTSAPPGSYLSVAVWNGGDNASDSRATIDNFQFQSTTIAGTLPVSVDNITPAINGFVDISATGGTPILGVLDDSEHNIVTTVGNALFPAGNVRISSNGVAIAGITSGFVSFVDQTIPAAGTPSGLPAPGTGYLLPLWDDLDLPNAATNTTIWWQETNNVLYIMWKDIGAFADVPGQVVTFQVQVFANPTSCGPSIQYLYPDTIFGGSQSSQDDGGEATVGYIGGGTFSQHNLEWSHNSPAVPSGTILTFRAPASSLSGSSPFGNGSLQLDYGASACAAGGSSYVLAVTLNQGTFPSGWLFGVDIPISQLLAEISSGAPFVGFGGSFTVGPFGGLPSGLSIYAVVLSFDGSSTLAGHSNALAYTIP